LINEGDATAGLIRSVEQLVLGEKLFAITLSHTKAAQGSALPEAPVHQARVGQSSRVEFERPVPVAFRESCKVRQSRPPARTRPEPVAVQPYRAWKGKKFFGWFSSRRFATSGLKP
jgi:hypothetical protein